MENFIIGVEIGGTKQQLSIGTLSGEIIESVEGRVETAHGAKKIRVWIKQNLPPLIEKCTDHHGKPIALGCGFGGPVATRPGRVLKSVHVPGWSDFPLKDWFEDNFGLPAVVANDTNAAAWGEYCNGSGRGTRQFFYTNMGTGVGGGLVLDGRLYDGQGYGAAEFGQTYVPDWTSAEPGRPEKIENLCSGLSIERRLRAPGYVPSDSLLLELAGGDASVINTRLLGQAASRGDAFALDELDRIGHAMGLGIANLLCLTNVEKVAIGGGVSNLGDLLLEPVRKYARQYEFFSSTDRYNIQICELGSAIVLVGAILLARDHAHINAGRERHNFTLLETNMDDMNPEVYSYLIDKLYAAGAWDVTLIPVYMKKNRPGTLLQVAVSSDKAEVLKGIIFAETSTLGIRQQTVEGDYLPRHNETVITEFGKVRIKVADLGDGSSKFSVEYEDCKKLAELNAIPLIVVMDAARAAYLDMKS